MGGSYEPVPAFQCNPCFRMPVPKVDERVAGNDPHGGLYHVPRLGTTPNAERLRQVFHYLRRLHLSRGRSSLSAPAQIRPSGLPAYGSASRARRRGALGRRVETDN